MRIPAEPTDGELLAWVRGVVEAELGMRECVAPPQGRAWQTPLGVFVTLKTDSGHLRGCIGYPMPVLPLGEAMARAARAAAFQDPRFSPVGAEEWKRISIEVSLLSGPVPLRDHTDLEVGRHGLMLRHPRGQGLLLPQVAVEQGWGPAEFLDQVCLKAGLTPGAWRDSGAVVEIFEARVVREEGS